ncbi:hypothetical protein [Opitutus terrae]|uniref:GreA/GreB family elongation factor n=1 Tax=Opitutus terrae (strain DSM 11246 / JCM 15787 / PB90-1) TaxID=452637 RepID=B1ZU18_OPITP|nr:hypothetical protein [Opitutus terrae]ACB75900.1 GreA/GreB family elongation factor [Opitutus terrae PB90-1]
MDTIYITTEDNARLRLLLLLSPYTDTRQRERELLRRGLDRAAILPLSADWPEAIRLGVAFEYEDLDNGVIHTGCLCLPDEEATTAHGIPVLSRFGAAVIGCCVGNEVWWAEMDRSRRILVRRVGTAVAHEPGPEALAADAALAEPAALEPQFGPGRAELQTA